MLMDMSQTQQAGAVCMIGKTYCSRNEIEPSDVYVYAVKKMHFAEYGDN